MTKEQMFYKALQDVFIGAKIEGEGGFINLIGMVQVIGRKTGLSITDTKRCRF